VLEYRYASWQAAGNSTRSENATAFAFDWEAPKASMSAKVEHPFRMIKRPSDSSRCATRLDDDVCAFEAVDGPTAISGQKGRGAPVKRGLAGKARYLAQFLPDFDAQSDGIRLVTLSAVFDDACSDLP